MHRFFKLTTSFALLSFFAINSFSQVYYGTKASVYIKGADEVRFTKEIENPDFFKFANGKEIAFIDFFPWFNENFKISDKVSFKLIKSERDELGLTHFRYQQLYANIPVNGAEFYIHVGNEKVKSFNGVFYSDLQFENSITLNETSALQFALNEVKSDSYIWQFPEEEQWLKDNNNDPGASYYPHGLLEILKKENKFYFVYKFDIYSKKPLTRPDIFVDAQNGNIVTKFEKIIFSNTNGTAVTRYSGTKPITTDSYNGSYRLRETGRGAGTSIQTYNLAQGTNFGSATDFTDSDNNWNNANAQKDEVAGDIHWATETTYDYFYSKFNRNSIDNNGFTLKSYVHYDSDFFNAFYDGQRFAYGDGDNRNNYNPLASLEIVAHEITHGVSNYAAGLSGSGENGALNEGFSDIFGTAIEFFAKPTTADWLMGGDINYTMRNLSNPNASMQPCPDTYLGDYWDAGMEVHYNSTVLSHWFYLLCVGGTGTNDNGNAYNVTGITMAKAERIAFRTLDIYLTGNSDYFDARFYSIKAAADIYGGCSPEVEATTNAWYAVGVGGAYYAGVLPDFTADILTNCSAPLTVNFLNNTMNGNTYLWKFGDGATSTLSDPTHTYTATGTYNVKLVANGGVCGADSVLKNSFIVISSSAVANLSMPISGTGQVQTCCHGTLKDPGGIENYPDQITSTITISPSGAAFIILNFSSFNLEDGYDYLKVYNGPSTASPLIGNYTGANLPNGGQIITTASSVTLQFTTDQAVNSTGFELAWECAGAVVIPVADFQANETTTCSGLIQFTDLSTNYPTSWVWKFGDGDSSLVKNPVHKYLANGDYTVTLKAKNSAGSNSVVKTNYIHVGTPAPPLMVGDTICNSGAATLYVSNPGYDIYSWYDAQTNGNFITYGTSYTTPVISSNTTFYVEGMTYTPSLYGAKPDSSGGGGGYYGNTSNIHYLIFNAFKPFELVSVKVYANGAGNRNIILRDSAQNVIKDTTVSVPAGMSRITLNFKVPVGNKMQLVGGGAPNLYRNRLTATYPYTMAGVFSVTESSASMAPYNATGNYYYFYDWEVKATDCITARAPVTALVSACSGIKEEQNSDNILVYPIPSCNYLNIEFRSNTNSTYNIYLKDITGRTLRSLIKVVDEVNRIVRIDIDDLPKGFYLLELDNGVSSTVRKIVIE